MGNQYPETVAAFQSTIEDVKRQIASGRPASAIANGLHAEGIGIMHMLVIFREATGASLFDLKSFGQWWGSEGVTDAPAFDAWAEQVLSRCSAERK